MGAYDSYFTGQFDITPPLTWAEIRDSRSPGLQDLRIKLQETVTETDAGRTTTITGVAVLPFTEEPYNGSEIETELQSLLDAHPTHAFEGMIEARPEDPYGDPWRYVVRERRAVQQVPTTEWRDAGDGGDQ